MILIIGCLVFAGVFWGFNAYLAHKGGYKGW